MMDAHTPHVLLLLLHKAPAVRIRSVVCNCVRVQPCSSWIDFLICLLSFFFGCILMTPTVLCLVVLEMLLQASQDDSKFLVRVSFLQIYNEVVADLLDADSLKKVDQKGYLQLREDPNGGVYVNNLSEHIVKNGAEIVKLLVDGSKMRTVASTKMNRTSSRSHAVFTMIIEHSEVKDGETIVTIGKLNLVDLAGSERIKSTGITNADGKRMDEAKKINSSLTAFGKVILALTSPGNHHVPYRDSKLTRMLQGSLGGNCKTTMVTAAGPAAKNYIETLNSLKFASRAKNVKNYAVVNQDMTDQALLSAYQKEIERLKIELAKSANPAAAEPSVVVDTEALDALRGKHNDLELQNTQTQKELESKLELINKVESEKAELNKKMKAMEMQLLSGGSKIEEQPEFVTAVTEVEVRLQGEYERKLAALDAEKRRVEDERRRFAEEKAAFEAMRAGFQQTQTELAITAAAAAANPAALMGVPTPPPAMGRKSPGRRPQSLTKTKSWVEPSVEHDDYENPPPLSPYEASPGGGRRQSNSGGAQGGGGGDEGLGESDGTSRQSSVSPRRRVQPTSDRRSSTTSMRSARGSAVSMMSTYSMHPGEVQHGGLVSAEAEAAAATVGLEIYLKALCHPSTGIPTSDVKHNHQYHRGVFSGNVAMEWFIKNMEGVDTPELAQSVGQKFLNLDVFTSLDQNDVFCTSKTDMYSFSPFDSRRSLRPKTPVTVKSPRGSVSVAVPRRWQSAAQAHQAVSAFQGGRPNTHGGRPAPVQHQEQQRPMTTAWEHQGGGGGGEPPRSPTSPGPPSSARTRPSTASRLRRRVSAVMQAAANLASPRDNGHASTWSSGDLQKGLQDAGNAAPRESFTNQMDPATEQLLADAAAAGASLLHSAAAQGDRNAMKTFFQTFPVDCTDRVGRTPLLYASINNKVKAVELLIKQGAEPSIKDGTGRSALFFAAYYGHQDVLKVLLRADRQLALDSDPEGRTAIHWATKHQTTKCLDMLLKVCPPAIINVQDNEQVCALHWAVLCHNDDHAARLIKAGASMAIADGDGRSAVHYAVCNDAQRCLFVMLQQPGVDKCINSKDNRGRTALHLAIGAETPIMCAKILLDNSATDVNCTDSSMRTPLHWAAVCNRPDVIEVLFMRGANPNYRDVSGRTPMHYASEKNNQQAMQALHQLTQQSSGGPNLKSP